MMQNPGMKKMGPGLPGGIRRRSVSTAATQLVEVGPLLADRALPLLIKPAVPGVNLAEWAESQREQIDAWLLEHRALLFRGFDVPTVAAFEAVVAATSDGKLLEYKDRSTPRTNEGNRVYTSTIHPADQRINLHNEGTYWVRWAKKLYFCSLITAATGGATPIADVRKVYARIDPAIRQEFERRGWMLARNYNDGFGLPWQDVYQTQDKAEVEQYCREHAINFVWKEGDRLRTEQVRPAVRRHPLTGEPVWFNHMAFFHYTTLEPAVREPLLAEFGEEGLPYNTRYGDGGAIPPEVVEHVRQAYEAEKIIFPWFNGDILLLDNMTVAHAREPYTGDRQVVVAMTDATDEESLAGLQATGIR